MKIIFTSPFNPLWSKGVLDLASLLDAKVVSVGDLLRAEVKIKSDLGKRIAADLQSGELLEPDLVAELISHRFFDDSTNEVLVNYPINTEQAEALTKHLASRWHDLDACVFVDTSKDKIIEKFKSQFHCIDPLHPKLETSESNPKCEVCGKPMSKSYNLENDKVAYLIDSYFDENGVLSGSLTLSRLLGIEAISYTTPNEVVNKIRGLIHGNG